MGIYHLFCRLRLVQLKMAQSMFGISVEGGHQLLFKATMRWVLVFSRLTLCIQHTWFCRLLLHDQLVTRKLIACISQKLL